MGVIIPKSDYSKGKTTAFKPLFSRFIVTSCLLLCYLQQSSSERMNGTVEQTSEDIEICLVVLFCDLCLQSIDMVMQWSEHLPYKRKMTCPITICGVDCSAWEFRFDHCFHHNTRVLGCSPEHKTGEMLKITTTVYGKWNLWN